MTTVAATASWPGPNVGEPVFSPDGRYIAFTVRQQMGQAGLNLHRMNLDGTGQVRLTDTPFWATAVPENNRSWTFASPAWSPDGSQIAFISNRPTMEEGGLAVGRLWRIWVMNADGSNQRPMFSEEINQQLNLQYNNVDERVLHWR